jgi:hypothetical protein
MDYPRRQLQDHVAHRQNVCLLVPRQIGTLDWQHALVADVVAESCAISNKTKEQNYVFPLYLYPGTRSRRDGQRALEIPSGARRRAANFSPDFLRRLEARLGLAYAETLPATRSTFTPEDILNYTYAVLNCPAFRRRYAEFLKADFPRVPFTSDLDAFRGLAELGGQLLSAHLRPATSTRSTVTLSYPVPGNNEVARGHPKFLDEGDPEPLTGSTLAGPRIYINSQQFFEGAPREVWEFEVGSYQVCDKWLRDRQLRELSYEDLDLYQVIVGALSSTIRLMDEIDHIVQELPIS